MPLKIATWNVNSIRQRLEHLARFTESRKPDVICLQETKVDNETFPAEALAEMGYRHLEINGQKAYNGVAIASRLPFEALERKRWCGKDDCRHLAVRVNGLELHNFYVPSGGPTPDPEANDKFAHKIKFLKEMASWSRRAQVAERKLLLVGDLNVAPLENDVWNHKRLLRSVGHTPLETELMAKLRKAGGYIDVGRHFVPPEKPLYSWWGYRFPQSFEKNYGWRLDHMLASQALMPSVKRLETVTETRAWDRPADHVPLVVEIA